MFLTLEHFHIMITENKLAHQTSIELPIFTSTLFYIWRFSNDGKCSANSYFATKAQNIFRTSLLKGQINVVAFFFLLRKDPFVKFAAAKTFNMNQLTH
jgi:hypothetical protein